LVFEEIDHYLKRNGLILSDFRDTSHLLSENTL